MGGDRLATDSKKAKETKAHLVLIDESGLFLNPLVRRTWAPKGQTPILEADGGHRKKVSVIGGISISPKAQHLGFYFATESDGFYTAEKVADYLRHLLQHLRGNVLVVWDRGPNHKGEAIRELLRKNKRLHLEMLPPWAPDLNPVEAIWSWLKHGELANFTPLDLEQLDEEIVDRLMELKFAPGLIQALWDRSDLPFPQPKLE